MKLKYLLFSSLLLSSLVAPPSYAASLVGRLGIGMTNHLITEMPALSTKLQRNRSSALGALFGLDSSADGSFYAVGLKYYRYIYEEPQLNFYSALAGNVFTYNNTETDATEQGYQVDATFGSEFSFQGLESIGFSFEFGVGFSKYNGDSRVRTLGQSMIVSAVHFYL